MKLQTILKAIFGAITAGIIAAQTAYVGDSVISGVEYFQIALAVVGTFGAVWGVPNARKQ